MKIIIRIKANKEENVVLIAGNTPNTKVVPFVYTKPNIYKYKQTEP